MATVENYNREFLASTKNSSLHGVQALYFIITRRVKDVTYDASLKCISPVRRIHAYLSPLR